MYGDSYGGKCMEIAMEVMSGDSYGGTCMEIAMEVSVWR